MLIVSLLKKIDAFSAESETISALKAPIFGAFFSTESETLSAKFCHIFHAFFSPTVFCQD
jgi:hypothetical protein